MSIKSDIFVKHLGFMIFFWTGEHMYTNKVKRFQEVSEYYLKWDIMSTKICCSNYIIHLFMSSLSVAYHAVWGNTCSSAPGPLIILQKRAIRTIWTLWAPLQRTRGTVKLNWPSSVSLWPSQWTSYLSVS